jgi:hypothetical protein
MKIEDTTIGMTVKVIVGASKEPRIGEVKKVDVSLRYPVEVLLNGYHHWMPVGFDEIEPVEKIGG